MPLRIYYLHFLREGVTPYHAGPHGEHQGGQEAEAGVRGKLRTESLLGFFSGKARQGRVNSLGLTSVNNSNGLWKKGCTLVAWPWDNLGQRKYWCGV